MIGKKVLLPNHIPSIKVCTEVIGYIQINWLGTVKKIE